MDNYEDIIAGLSKLYNGLERAHGVCKVGAFNEAKGKMEARTYTLMEPVSDALWLAHLEGKEGLGVIPIRADNSCFFGAVDIDEYSLDLPALSLRLHKDKIPAIVCRTKSGGAHLYMFTSGAVEAKAMKGKLLELADYLGYPDSEVFPKQETLGGDNDVGNWINMPYHDGDSTVRYGYYKGEVLGLEAFVKRALAMRVTAPAFYELVIDVDSDNTFDDAPPCLRKLIRTGIPDGMRNKGLFNLGVFCKLAYGDNWETEINKMNMAYIDPPLEAKEVVKTLKSLNRKKYFYTCNEHPVLNYCNKNICRTRKYGIGGDDGAPPFVLGTLVKIDTIPPTWFIDVDGGRVELQTEDLLNQTKFRKLVVEKLNKLPRLMKGPNWDKLIAEKLANVHVVAAPQDISPAGQMLSLLQRYMGRPAGKEWHQLLTGKCIEDDGRIYFRGNDLLNFLEKERFKALSPKQVWAALRTEFKDDIQHKARQIDGNCVQLWSLPAPKKPSPAPPADITVEEPF